MEKDSSWDLRDLTSSNDRNPSGLQRIQSLCRDRDLSVPADDQAVQVLLKDALAALGSSHAGK